MCELPAASYEELILGNCIGNVCFGSLEDLKMRRHSISVFKNMFSRLSNDYAYKMYRHNQNSDPTAPTERWDRYFDVESASLLTTSMCDTDLFQRNSRTTA